MLLKHNTIDKFSEYIINGDGKLTVYDNVLRNRLRTKTGEPKEMAV